LYYVAGWKGESGKGGVYSLFIELPMMGRERKREGKREEKGKEGSGDIASERLPFVPATGRSTEEKGGNRYSSPRKKETKKKKGGRKGRPLYDAGSLAGDQLGSVQEKEREKKGVDAVALANTDRRGVGKLKRRERGWGFTSIFPSKEKQK